jgi:cell division septation protein DedD
MMWSFFETITPLHPPNYYRRKESMKMQSKNYSNVSAKKQLMSNKQVIAIFGLGIVMMFVAFWAGLSVMKGSIVSSSNQAAVKNTSTPQQQKPAEPPKQTEAAVASPTVEATPQTRYLVRVAAFGTQQKAEELKNELRKSFISAHVQMPEGTETLYNVNLGPFDRREVAQQVANDLSMEGKKILGIFQVNKN